MQIINYVKERANVAALYISQAKQSVILQTLISQIMSVAKENRPPHRRTVDEDSDTGANSKK